MHRTDSPGSVNGLFQDGNPATGQQATQLLAKWFNGIQEELAHVIEEANIVLDDADTTQLYAAIVAIAAGAGGGGGGGIPAERRVDAAGLATGGGDLVANRTITVTKATPTEAAAQVRDDVAVTPLGLAGLVGATISGNTLIVSLGTVKIQIFTGNAQAGTNTVFTLPQSFSSKSYAWANGGAIDLGASDHLPYVSGAGLTAVTVYNNHASALGVTIFAIGV